jgi:TetR/AcrR family transcriptional regulator, regulator of autoinduction and epiphytic fitness
VTVAEGGVDGRRLRRERNVRAVLDAVLEMFAEETLVPTIERAAERSGLSLRSVYRYFPDQESLTQAAIDEMWRRAESYAHLSRIGEGPFEDRVRAFARMRVRLYEHLGQGYRAGRMHAPRSVRIRDDLERTRRTLTEQFQLQFRPELDALPSGLRVARTATADVMSQFEAIDLLRRARRLTVDEAISVVEESIRVALTAR